jgi:hypothetical protein
VPSASGLKSGNLADVFPFVWFTWQTSVKTKRLAIFLIGVVMAEIMDHYPQLTTEGIHAALAYAADLAQNP